MDGSSRRTETVGAAGGAKSDSGTISSGVRVAGTARRPTRSSARISAGLLALRRVFNAIVE